MKKKIIAALSCLVASLLLFGCACSGSSGIDFSLAWKDFTSETLTYAVSFEETTEKREEGAPTYALNSGSYVATLTKAEQDGKTVYNLSTTLLISGSYTLNGAVTPFNDSILSNVTFKGSQDNLKPITSTKEVHSTSYVQNGKKFEIKNYDYKATATYKSKSVKFEKINLVKEGDNFVEGSKSDRTVTFSGVIFDNEMMFYGIRCISLKKGLNANFKVASLDEMTVHSMTASITKKAVEDTYNVNGADETAKFFNLSVGINETYSGRAISTCYKDDDISRLYKVTNVMPYGVGNLVYTLTNINFIVG